jgi:hypothetical protein
MNNVFILSSQYILNRWIKYAKRGYYVEKKGRQNENLKVRVARISRMATSLALKCSTSEPLLDDLERALENMESMADDSLNKMRENEVSFIGLNDHVIGTENSAISFRVPHVVKGSKSKRAKNVVEKNTRKKKKSRQEKGTGLFLHILFFSSISCLLIAVNIFQMLLKKKQGTWGTIVVVMWQYQIVLPIT